MIVISLNNLTILPIKSLLDGSSVFLLVNWHSDCEFAQLLFLACVCVSFGILVCWLILTRFF